MKKLLLLFCSLPLLVAAQRGQWVYVGEGKGTNKQDATNPTLPPDSVVSNNSPEIRPAARSAAAVWGNKKGELYFWGGIGTDDSLQSGLLADVWSFTATTQEWQKLHGNRHVEHSNQPTAQKFAAATTAPIGRVGASTWADDVGNLYLYGGATNNFEHFDDFWKFDVKNQQWVKLSGSNELNKKKKANGKNKTNSQNAPGARANAMTWTDSKGNLWLFGGSSYNDTERRNVYYNDLWKYTTNKNEWVWMSGSLDDNPQSLYDNSLKTDKADLQAHINKGLGGYATAEIGDDGKVVLTNVDGKNINDASESVKAFYETIATADRSATDITIGVVNNSENVSTGNYDKSRIDIADINAYDNIINTSGVANAASPQSKLAHEVTEQTGKQEAGYKKSVGFDIFHPKAVDVENRVIGNGVSRIPNTDIINSAGSFTQYNVGSTRVEIKLREIPREVGNFRPTVKQYIPR